MNAERIDDGKAVLLRIVGMLTKLVDRFDERQDRLQEDTQTYDDRPRPSSSFSSSKNDQIEDNDEHEDEEEEESTAHSAPGVYANSRRSSRPAI